MLDTWHSLLIVDTLSVPLSVCDQHLLLKVLEFNKKGLSVFPLPLYDLNL